MDEGFKMPKWEVYIVVLAIVIITVILLSWILPGTLEWWFWVGLFIGVVLLLGSLASWYAKSEGYTFTCAFNSSYHLQAEDDLLNERNTISNHIFCHHK